MSEVQIALETSSRAPSVAVWVDGATAESSLATRRSHASDLVPTLAELLAALGAAPGDIGAVLVGTGPGSYTGLRVGIATALGLQRGAGASLRGVPSGEVLAHGELAEGEECVHLLDARQGELYFAHYALRAGEVEALYAPRVLSPAELPGLLPAGVPIFGDATVARAAELGPEECARLRTDSVPRAAALLELGKRRLAHSGGQDPAEVEPLYLRPFAARVRRR